MSAQTFRELLLQRFKAELGDRPQAWTAHGVEEGTLMAGAREALLLLADEEEEPMKNAVAMSAAVRGSLTRRAAFYRERAEELR